MLTSLLKKQLLLFSRYWFIFLRTFNIFNIATVYISYVYNQFVECYIFSVILFVLQENDIRPCLEEQVSVSRIQNGSANHARAYRKKHSAKEKSHHDIVCLIVIIEFLKSLNISFYEFAIITTSFPCIFISHVPNFLVTKNLYISSR